MSSIIGYDQIVETVAQLCVQANVFLPEDVYECLLSCREKEDNPLALDSLDQLVQNADLAAKTGMPICQDTGMAVFFVELGNQCQLDCSLTEAINQGVRQGYQAGYLRNSVVGDPLFERLNTGDNTPAIIHLEHTKGAQLKITMMPKGFGSENMSGICLLSPDKGEEGVVDFVMNTVKAAGPNPCPPMVVGVGIGGDFEMCAMLAKKALMRPLHQPHSHPYYRELEDRLLRDINMLNVGPQGFGGKTTALSVKIETFATHIASLPVAVNMCCHASRHKTLTIVN